MGKFFLFFFSLSLTIPQFGLLSHISSFKLSSGHSGRVFTLSMHSKPPCLGPARWWQTWASGLLLHWELQFRHIFCGVFYFSSRLCCPLKFQNFPQTLQWEGFLLFGNFSFTTPPFPGRVSIPNSLTLFLSFIFCPTSFRREWAAFLGAWCPPPAFRSCFVEVAQHSNDLLMILLWWKWSSHPIPLPSCLSFLRHYPCFALYQHLPAVSNVESSVSSVDCI